MASVELKLDELAEQAGVAPRTVRYYVQRGLLPAPPFRGRDTVYGAEHLARLQAIRAMQARYLPLDEIEAALNACTTVAQIEAVARGEPAKTGKTGKRGKGSASDEGQEHGHGRDHGHGHSRDHGHGRGHGEERGAGPVAWRRWELAPGLELHLSDDAGDEGAALARELVALVNERRGR